MFVNNPRYINQMEQAINLRIDWESLREKSFLVTGATGLIGTFFIDILMFANEHYDLDINVYAVGRNESNASKRFKGYSNNKNFTFIKQDINNPLGFDISCDYIIHGASNTHPVAYAADPIGTIATNVVGTQNILEFSAKLDNPRIVFLSTVEIYGENRGDVDKFDESYCGYIDCNVLRAGYPESKRLGEALCQAYLYAKKLDIVIPRLSRVYGPTMSQGDSKAIAQFINKAVNREDIVLKSLGNQLYSYTYVADAAIAILYIMLYGKCGEAYNVSDDYSEITLKDLADILARIASTEVVYELPDLIEASGYSKVTKALLNNDKLKQLGWKSYYNIKTGLKETVDILVSREGQL